MAEYISRERLIEKLGDSEIAENDRIDIGYNAALNDVKQYLTEMPAADVQLVKHGYWEEVTDYGGWGDTHYRCSVCGEEWYLEDGNPKDNNMNYCPRCGARMDGEQNE